MTNWIVRNKRSIIRSAFLIPIFSVAAISISHVVSWYDLANPIGWAIYLSIAVEVAAMSAIAATSVKVKGFSVWFVFIIVTLIQFIGNIFFSFSEIDVNSKEFKDWMDLTSPIFEAMGSDVNDSVAQRRWLALLEGGLLPLISLTCLHFFIKYGEIDEVTPEEKIKNEDQEIETTEVNAGVDLEEDIVEELSTIEAISEEPKSEPAQEVKPSQENTKPLAKPAQPIKKPAPQISSKMKKIIGRK
jgi:hypothetical protein